MYKAFWNMSMDPFDNALEAEKSFESDDLKQVLGKLQYLKGTLGLGLITGSNGVGKTFALDKFAHTLDTNRFLPVEFSMTSCNSREFPKILAKRMGLAPRASKCMNYINLQDQMKALHEQKHMIPVFFIDEGQYLSREVLIDLTLLMNFGLDRKRHAVFILCGRPEFRTELALRVYDNLTQHIVVDHQLTGLRRKETERYVEDRLKLAGVTTTIFDPYAIATAYDATTGNIRHLNNLLTKALMIGFTKKEKTITQKMMLAAVEECKTH